MLSQTGVSPGEHRERTLPSSVPESTHTSRRDDFEELERVSHLKCGSDSTEAMLSLAGLRPGEHRTPTDVFVELRLPAKLWQHLFEGQADVVGY